MSMHDDYLPSEIWQKAAGVWTILSAVSFVAVLVGTVWFDGPIGKIWITWFILGIVGSIVLWVIAAIKEGPL